MGKKIATIFLDGGRSDFSIEDENQPVCIGLRTTFNYKKFKDIVEIIEKKRYDITVLNTI